MSDSCTLALTRLEEFAAWAVRQGYVRDLRNPMPDYQVLRLRQPGKGKPMLIWYSRAGTMRGGDPVHATCEWGPAGALVRRWLKARKANLVQPPPRPTALIPSPCCGKEGQIVGDLERQCPCGQRWRP